MTFYPNVTKEDLITLDKIAEQQKIQKDVTINKNFFNQTHFKKLAENYKPITKKLTETDYSTANSEEI